VATYSQTIFRFTHLEQAGFSLWHFTLEEAQAWQLSRRLGVVEVLELFVMEEDEGNNELDSVREPAVVDWCVAMVMNGNGHYGGYEMRSVPGSENGHSA
jgi:hypothetical protein